MYCSLEEAWPQMNINKQFQNNSNNFKRSLQSKNYDTSTISQNNDDDDYIDNSPNRKQNNKFRSSGNELPDNFKNNKNSNNKILEFFNDDKNSNISSNKINNLKCDDVLDHISNCNECLRNIYKKYNLFGIPHNGLSQLNIFTELSNGFNKLITKENRDVVTVVLIGLLVILILQLLKSDT